MISIIKIVILVAVGLLVAFLLYRAWKIMQTFKVGGALARAAIRYEQHPDNPRGRILVIGDSTAVGTGATDNVDSVPGRVGRKFPDFDLINRGVNGARVSDLVTSFVPTPDEHYDLIEIHIGGNDILRQTPLPDIERDLSTVLERATAIADHVVVFTTGKFGDAPVYFWPVSSYLTNRGNRVREIFLKSTKSAGAVYVDIIAAQRIFDPFEKDRLRFYATDNFHPGSEGYGSWFNVFEQTIEQAGIKL